MSRWLSNVHNLLEKLDGTVEEVIEDQREEDVKNLDSILAKRGLKDDVVEDEPLYMQEINIDPADGAKEAEVEAQNSTSLESREFNTKEIKDKENTESKPKAEKPTSTEDFEAESAVKEDNQDSKSIQEETNDQTLEDEVILESDFEKKVVETSSKDIEVFGSETDERSEAEATPVEEQEAPSTEKTTEVLHNSIPVSSQSVTPTSNISEQKYKEMLANVGELQRETKTLRRHVVSLNKQLESAESELEAQRIELSQAGDRLEANRKKAKEEKEKLISQHSSLVKTIQQEKDQLLNEIKARHQQQLEELQQVVRESDEKRMQEGGDWTKELENTIERERELVRKLALVEDEKSTLLSQISTLQSQYDRVQSRLDSISQTADNAMMREREAEDKLDMALSMHARQLNQRQSREADLERTIAELSASLASLPSSLLSDDAEGDTAAGASTVIQLKNQVHLLEEELENTKAQLSSEKQRVVIMQHELRDMSKERTLEATSARSKQHQFDRQIADMSLQISKLQSSLRQAKKSEGIDAGKSGAVYGESGEVAELTEQVVRQQEKIAQATSENAALRNRLQVALERANKAERTVESVEASTERDVESGNYGDLSSDGDGIRRRRRRNEISIRSAINLSSQNKNTERIGKAIDSLDNFSVQTGKYLRYNPLARGGFILYLIMLHAWTFVVLFFHAHKFETIHGDFGAGHQLSPGPHALMQQSNPAIFKQVVTSKVETSNSTSRLVVQDSAAIEDGGEEKQGS
mmetsp:Transcript_31917/g.47108  ORF Transcript_31917/g.47108 Transcript_31917/m.47108 type:complete len:756 (+) Transcript_31917:214-2481(+)|eukprot:CAMPEP_0194216370 /NCGR_PEP_ID=MMETSP0156-20130528/18850_1 /TAXON_ID=33649 /ORGANISM="Thalassionema nitzschioides, Strain L26-B" /LENGTH=755 /DNA_ID=CAMNT_0038945125 /DNA_START=140 /DNA_END=2407 /DNA_ORIENTATION=+